MVTPKNTSKNCSLDIKVNIDFTHFSLAIDEQLSLSGITGVFGDSGSGKSTLLRIIAGLETQAKGRVIFDKRYLQDSTAKIFVKTEQRDIGLIFQDSRLFPHLTVYENLTFAARLKNKRYKKANLTEKINIEKIIALTQLSELISQNVNSLSGGEKQRVSLARALLAEPTLLLLDEPFSALDKKNKAEMIQLVKRIQQQLAIPMIYVSHSISELQAIAKQLVILSEGRIEHILSIHDAIHQLNYQESSRVKTSLSLTIAEHLSEYGLTRLALDKHSSCVNNTVINKEQGYDNEASIYTALLTGEHYQIGQQLPCIIYARDISISINKPDDSSIVNHLFGTITQIKSQGNSVFVSVRCHGQMFYVQISLWSKNRMALKEEQQVYIQFKANAVYSIFIIRQ